MHLPTYKPHSVEKEQFIEFWRRQYNDPNEHLYEDNIRQTLTEQTVLNLYRWKNGTPLSQRKTESLRRNFIERIDELEAIGKDANIDVLLARFTQGGAIWKIFWLHCWEPDRFPIYDQHVHRAMAFIQKGVREEIPTMDECKILTYKERYLAFHSEFHYDNRIVDKALWTFGKFLKLYPNFS